MGWAGPLWLPHVQIPVINSTSQVLALNIHLSVSAVEWKGCSSTFNYKQAKPKMPPCPECTILDFSFSCNHHRADTHTDFHPPNPSNEIIIHLSLYLALHSVFCIHSSLLIFFFLQLIQTIVLSVIFWKGKKENAKAGCCCFPENFSSLGHIPSYTSVPQLI